MECRGNDENLARCIELVDGLIQKLQPHPRAEIHRRQVFEYVKKVIERAVQQVTDPSLPTRGPLKLRAAGSHRPEN